MQPADREEFLRVLNGLSAMKGKPLAMEALDLWWASMQDWPIESFKQAAAHLVKSCQFMPTPYDFEQLLRSQEMTAAEAWNAAMSNNIEDPVVKKCLQAIGGHRMLMMADIETQLPHLSRRFMQMYDELKDSMRTRKQLGFSEDGIPKLNNLIRKSLPVIFNS